MLIDRIYYKSYEIFCSIGLDINTICSILPVFFMS